MRDMSHTHIGPYFLFPDVTIKRASTPEPTCKKCHTRADRFAKFCSKCGGPIVMTSKEYEHTVDLGTLATLFHIDESSLDHLRQVRESPFVLPNMRNKYSSNAEIRYYGVAFDFATAKPEAAIAWFKKECKVITDWLAANNHPEGTFHFGVVNYVY